MSIWEEKEIYKIHNLIGEVQSCRCKKCGKYTTIPYLYYFDEPNFCMWCGEENDKEEEQTK